MSSHDAATLRASFLSDAERLLPTKRRRPRAGIAPSSAPTAHATATATVARRHAAVQGLRAFVLSAPYDVPDWLPEVLMALVRVAGEPGPVKTTVTKTLAEFRRTHEVIVVVVRLAELSDARHIICVGVMNVLLNAVFLSVFYFRRRAWPRQGIDSLQSNGSRSVMWQIQRPISSDEKCLCQERLYPVDSSELAIS